MRNSEVDLVKYVSKYYQMLEYYLNWHSFNIIKSFAYASAMCSCEGEKNINIHLSSEYGIIGT